MAKLLPEDILKQVRRIEITTKKIVTDVMTGQYKSQFKGHGVQFSEHRPYLPGDDIRHIDWKVTARTKEPLIKKFEEERELNVLLVVDISASEGFGTKNKLKSEIAAELGLMMAYAAIMTGDKVGAVLFTHEVEKIIPPKKGKSHILRIASDLLGFEPKHKGTNISSALQAADRLMKQAGIIFVISDFYDQNYDVMLKKVSRRHDVIAIRLQDQREKDIPDMGTVLFTDPETGEDVFVNTKSYLFKEWIKKFNKKNDETFFQIIRGSAVESLNISTDEDYGQAVARFFHMRHLRAR